MLQMDGSHHDWFEGRGPWCVLMVIIDDATNFTYARFYEGETMAAAMDCFWRYATGFRMNSTWIETASTGATACPQPPKPLPAAGR